MGTRSTPAGGGRVQPTTGSRLAGVEGLRALAALSVVVFHVQFRLGHDSELPMNLDQTVDFFRWGLTLFFILSGHLLFRPFAAAIIAGRPLPDPRRFLRNRGLRILPAYWVILLAVVILGWAQTHGANGEELSTAGLLLTDGLLLQNLQLSTLFSGIPPAWSLVVEITFYLLLPLLAIGAAALARRSGRRVAGALAPVGLLLVMGVATKIVLEAGAIPEDSNWQVLRTSILAHADLFAFGMFAAVVHVLADRGRIRLPRGARWAMLAGCALALAIAVSVPRPELPVFGQMNDIPAGIACALLLLAVVLPVGHGQRRPLGVRFLELWPVVRLGVISYSIYLWHDPLLIFLRDQGVEVEGGSTMIAVSGLAIAACVVLAEITFRLVEAPALRRRRSPAPETRPEAPEAPAEPAPSPAIAG